MNLDKFGEEAQKLGVLGIKATQGGVLKAERLWDEECFVDDNTLTVNINRLRRSLREIGLVDFIHTKKGVGYQIDT